MSGGHGGQLDEGIVAQRCHGFQGHVAGALHGPLDGMDHPLPEPGSGWSISHQSKDAYMSPAVWIGLGLSQSVFQIHGVDDAGRAVLRRRLSRHELLSYFAKLPGCLVGMEAGSAAHPWARELSR